MVAVLLRCEAQLRGEPGKLYTVFYSELFSNDGLTPRDLELFIGPRGRVFEVLNRNRPLSLRMVKRLHDGLRIPYESLLTEGS
jgi:antitoxin component HigA of HigAB toxin-antitoxin module